MDEIHVMGVKAARQDNQSVWIKRTLGHKTQDNNSLSSAWDLILLLLDIIIFEHSKKTKKGMLINHITTKVRVASDNTRYMYVCWGH